MFERLAALIGDRRVEPPLPPGRLPVAGGVEPDERDGTRDDASAWAGFITYTDAHGVDSMRRVTCRKIGGYGRAETISGYCHERSAARTFRIDRINELVCVETGEVLDPFPFFESLRLRGALQVNDKALTELARVMVFLARCDGNYHPLERQALEEHIGNYVRRFGGDDQTFESAVLGCGRLAPDSTDFITALKRFAKAPNGPRLCRFVLDCGAAVIDADGEHTPEEIRWAVEMSDVLKTISDRA